ncbi:hypothetical protein ACNJ7E_41920 [Rhodococcus sp. NM-2]
MADVDQSVVVVVVGAQEQGTDPVAGGAGAVDPGGHDDLGIAA